MAEIELSVFTKQCLSRRIEDIDTLRREAKAWADTRNVTVNFPAFFPPSGPSTQSLHLNQPHGAWPMTQARNQQSKRKRRSREDWQALIRRFDLEQGSVTAFCIRESISEASFYRWRGLLASGAPQRKPPPRPSEFLDLGGGLMLHLVRG